MEGISGGHPAVRSREAVAPPATHASPKTGLSRRPVAGTWGASGDSALSKSARASAKALSLLLFLAGTAAGASAAGALSDYRLLLLGGGTVKWGSPVLGEGAVVTYAVVDRPVAFDGARNCASLAPLDGLLDKNRISRARFDAELAVAFKAWSEAANVSFKRVDGTDANILFGAQGVPVGRAFTNVAHEAAGGPDRAGRIVGSVICMNPEQAWKVGFDGDLEVYDVRYTLMHEIGHAIGLDHPGVPGELMDFRYLETFSALQPGDRAGAASLYGPRLSATAGAGVETGVASTASRNARAGREERAIGPAIR